MRCSVSGLSVSSTTNGPEPYTAYQHVVLNALTHPWAILPDQLEVLSAILARRVAGKAPDMDAIQAAVGQRRDPASSADGAVAVLPLYGTLYPKANLMSEMSGGTAVGQWVAVYESLMADDSIGAVVLDIDSPGGSVQGIEEAAQRMKALRGTKPVVAVSAYTCASAAYWLASQADQIVASPSSITGSIGVYTIHEDLSAALEAEGVKVTFVSAGRYKVEGNPYEALGDEAFAFAQDTVNDIYGKFTAAVAEGRGVKAGAVRNGYGEGRALTAGDALQEGLVDRVETLAEVVGRMQKPRQRQAVLKGEHAFEDAEHSHVYLGSPAACITCGHPWWTEDATQPEAAHVTSYVPTVEAVMAALEAGE